MVYLNKKLMNKNILNSLLWVVYVFLLISCNQTKYVAVNKANFNDNAYKYLNEINFNSNIKLDFDLKIKSDKNYSVKGILKYYTNNEFQFVLYSKTLGVEIIKMQLNNDSLLVINRLNKTYFKIKNSPYKLYNNVQLFPEDVIKIFYGKLMNNLNNFNYNNNEVSYNYLSYKGLCSINKKAYIVNNNISNDRLGLNIVYSEYSKKYNLPSSILINVSINNDTIDVAYKLKNITELSGKIKYYTIPENYSKTK